MLTFRNLGKQGRLGNQLWQIAATIGIADKQGDDVVFPADWIYRPYFNIPDNYFGEIPNDAIESTNFATHLDPRCRGYLQDYNLIEGSLSWIQWLFRPSKKAVMEFENLHNRFEHMPIMGIHVRRGDNVVDPGVPNKSDYHLTPSRDYYWDGAKRLYSQEKMATACFSDDIPWCKENIPAQYYGRSDPYFKEHEPQYGVVPPTDWIDFFTLARCDYYVLSGSTFGIWAALCSGAPGKRIIRPSKVYGHMLSYIDEELLFPPDWTVLRCS